MSRRLSVLVVIGLLLVLGAALRAATPEVLVEERAREVWGVQLPEAANIRVRLTQKPLDDAVMLSAFWMDRNTGRFLANAVDEAGETKRIEGMALATLDVPVPVRRMMPGEILRDADIQDVELPLNRIGTYSVTERDKLVGMEVRRMLAQGRQVMTHSITAPIIVGRGEKVSILYDDGALVLTAPGKSLSDAHAGEEITVVNLVSNKSLRAVAREDGLVEVIR